MKNVILSGVEEPALSESEGALSEASPGNPTFDRTLA